MHVLFGHSPYEGYLYIPQIYSFGQFLFLINFFVKLKFLNLKNLIFLETKKWRKGEIDPAILGRFGHSSVIFNDPNNGESILVYGGYNAPLSSYTYAITDELLVYIPSKQIWFKKYFF